MIHRRPADRPVFRYERGCGLSVGMQIVATTRGRRSIDLLDARVSVGVNRVSSSPCYKCARVAGSLVKKGKKKKKEKISNEFHRPPPLPSPQARYVPGCFGRFERSRKGKFP